MEIRRPAFDVWIEPEDAVRIGRALYPTRESSESAPSFAGAELYRLYEAWQTFVEVDWTRWDHSEYLNDIRCRSVIQVAIENSFPETRKRLESAVASLDELFRQRMRPIDPPISRTDSSKPSYFWETHTIHDTPPVSDPAMPEAEK